MEAAGWAPGKAILFGEHAVVYGRLAVAVPLRQVGTRAVITNSPTGESWVEAPDIGLSASFEDLAPGHPLRQVIEQTARISANRLPPFHLRVTSTIPVASGLGSGAAVSIAVIRALMMFLHIHLSDTVVADLAYEAEKIHHGTPSGIDNTVIAYQKPITFRKDAGVQVLDIPVPFHLLIASTGHPSSTKAAVSSVRELFQADAALATRLFDQIETISNQAVKLLKSGNPDGLGMLMDQNQQILRELGVSSPELESLIQAARAAGALGAKLSGAGRGGNMIALVRQTDNPVVAKALAAAGAADVFASKVE